MKLVTAIIKPFRIDDVREALCDIGVQGMTVTEVRGFSRHDVATRYRGAEHVLDFIPALRLEAGVGDALVERVIETIERAARTGKSGDGKILVTPIEQVIRIRTGETGEEAL